MHKQGIQCIVVTINNSKQHITNAYNLTDDPVTVLQNQQYLRNWCLLQYFSLFK
jgi:hypothetical protein